MTRTRTHESPMGSVAACPQVGTYAAAWRPGADRPAAGGDHQALARPAFAATPALTARALAAAPA